MNGDSKGVFGVFSVSFFFLSTKEWREVSNLSYYLPPSKPSNVRDSRQNIGEHIDLCLILSKKKKTFKRYHPAEAAYESQIRKKR